MSEHANVHRIASLDDPRVGCYRNLKDRELARLYGRFIAEGEQVVRRLLASDLATDSVLLADGMVDEIVPLVAPGVPVYVAPAEVVSEILGFSFHCGVIACGRRGPSPTLDAVMAGLGPSAMLVIVPDVTKSDNLGALVRISAGLGASAMVLGEQCCDPFYRQAVRVSMGAVFKLPLVRSADIEADLRRLGGQFGVELIATVLDGAAEPLAAARRSPRIGVLLGNEAQGLSPRHVALCARRVTIPMQLGVDSLNVAVAAGIVLHHFATCDGR